MGLESAESGTVSLAGNEISRTPPSQRNFGVVFQSYSLFPNLTAVQNVTYGLECRRWPKQERRKRAQDMLDLVHLADQADKLPAQMSGGQQQRVAIARALAPQPSLLLLDEPLSALDANVRGELRTEIRKIQQELGITTIMVTHDQSEALEMADQIVVLNMGQIEQVGTPHEIYNHPQTEFIANFIGNFNVLKVVRKPDGTTCYGSGPLTTAAHVGEGAILGLRPEAIRVSDAPLGLDNTLFGNVTAVRFLGNIQMLTVQPECAPDQRLEVELHGMGRLPRPNDRICMNFNADLLCELKR